LDTTYTVVAELANGCTVVDTIRIKVNQSTLLHLGNDTSFCAGDSLQLKAPPGFATYLWQDGSSGSTLTTGQQGLYWLQAKAANGCISKDSVLVNNVYPLPLNFLDAGTAICNGKNLELKALGNWSSYLWFNNSSSSSVTINTPGKYWLQVTSTQGCKGRDTIEVLTGKNCSTGIHFPNAFTPDRNGNNDTWKPVAWSVPTLFHLLIFNRFGEKVFETTDFKQGWDGMFKGKLQPPETFVWYCTYQLTGAAAQLEKGTLVLVR
jgi:gliding motility-associated-like protein